MIQKKKRNGIRNSLYIIKLLLKIHPSKIVFSLIYAIIRYVFNAVFWVSMPKILFDSIEKNESFSKLFTLISFMCLGYIIFHIITVFYMYYEKTTDPQMFGKLFNEIINKAIKLPLSNYENPTFYDHYYRVIDEIETNLKKLIDSITELAGNIAAFITITIIISKIDSKILLFLIIPIVTGFLSGRINSKLSIKLQNLMIRNLREVDYTKRLFYERKYAYDIRTSQIKSLFLDLNKKCYESMTNISYRYIKKSSIVNICDYLIRQIVFVILCGIYILYQILIKNKLTIGTYMSMLVAMQNINWQIEDLVNNAEQFMTLDESFLYLKKFLQAQNEEYEDGKIKKEILTDSFQALELHNVSYTYEGAVSPSIRKINLAINKGERIAFVGYNGAGKSTLSKIIMGLYHPSGTILYNSKDINDFVRESYRTKFATIFQDFQIYAISIASNILLRQVENSEDEKIVECALKQVGLYEKIIALEQGIYTPITKELDENGVLLSGGELQRIALARLFAANKEAEIVILDEPSSALDPVSEYNLYNAISEITNDKTIIMISHRLSSVKNADRIYMMENGEIIEVGNHHELMLLNGKYAQMFKLQAQNYTCFEL